jgi:hypothetical protein
MHFHDDMQKAFAPLENHVKENYPKQLFNETMSNYMYMGNDQENDNLYYYKHKLTRDYLKIEGRL